ncbi:phosphate ABC transporter permease PstA [Campylobacter geochelonis]|uniref:Phosphate transport system permease protein PstA n=1 Tax=Campylobacter geochelonis TaxID=1780362 RepID=A0A128ELN5_9BACT|nr:phosphate ABC transporter permease PstA [Campylobacter geochelonis]QKF71577.1 phosphate ABC transporter, permease protein (DUF3333 domain) [Campylobacter geochelonis]CZE48609.1 Phosphate transport system permease protein PstA (TC 3.A.1.7.1) [Campylobacter geochelonis]CZE49362.1 Phosphate transport system permease protein PstA (TC 3.A.1.7.1) [Campylobacter geochelonis]
MIEQNNPFIVEQIAKRNKKGERFEYIALSALMICIAFLTFFLYTLIKDGLPAFKQAYVKVEFTLSQEIIKNPYSAVSSQLRPLVSRAWLRNLPARVKNDKIEIGQSVSYWALSSSQTDQYIKENYNKLTDNQKNLVDDMVKNGLIKQQFNGLFFKTGDSKIPESAGLLSAAIGTIMTMLVTMSLALPLGVATAIYLEEFAKDNKFTQFIEININNLNAVPSILFGLLGLAVFINIFGVPRSSPLVGGMTLALMSLPVIIVSSRSALRAVPATIRQAGFGLGLTKLQIVKDHVLPLAMPGILTGSIIALAQAMGETAPLMIVGMIAFVPDAPETITQAATVMPAQIFTWSGMPERMYVEKTSAGILVLLTIMLVLNSVAIYLRKKFQRKW